MRRLIGFGRVVAFVAVNLALAVVFARMWEVFGPPTAASDPVDALGGVVVLIGLVMVGWMLLSTVLYMGAVASGVPALIRSVEWMTIAPVRKIVNHSVAGVIAASALTSAAPAMASPATPEPQVYEMDITPRSWLDSGVEQQRRTEGIEAARVAHTAQRFAESAGVAARLAEYLPHHRGAAGAVTVDVDVAASEGAEEAEEATTVTVESGDNMWVLAERQLETVLGRAPTDQELHVYWLAVVSANAETVRSGDVSLIYPGEVLTMPSVSDVLADPDGVGALRLTVAGPDLDDDPDDDPGDEPEPEADEDVTTVPASADETAEAPIQAEAEAPETSAPVDGLDPVSADSEGVGADPFAGVVSDVAEDVVDVAEDVGGVTAEVGVGADPFGGVVSDVAEDVVDVAEDVGGVTAEVGVGADPFGGVVSDVAEPTAETEGTVSWAGSDDPVDEQWAETFGSGSEPPPDEGEVVWMEATPPADEAGGFSTKAAMFGVGGTAALGAAGALFFRKKAGSGGGGNGGGSVPPAGDKEEVVLQSEDRVDERWRWAAGAALVGLSDPAPTPQAVTVGTERCWVVSPGSGDRTPRGFMASRPGLWEIPTSALVDRYEEVAAEALPGLVRLGTTEDGATVAANVEDALVVSMDGAKPHVQPIVAAVAERLAAQEEVRVVWIGEGAPRGCETLTVGQALDLLERIPRPAHTSVVTRRRGVSQPLVVVAAVDVVGPVRADLLASLASFGPDRGVAALVTWVAPEARPEFAWRVPDHGTLQVGSLSPIKVDGVKAAKMKTATVDDAAPPPGVEVQILGEPRLMVEGEEVTDVAPKTVEAAVWLATHRRGGSAETLIDAFWPDNPRHVNKKPHLHRIMSSLRSEVGETVLPKPDRQRSHDSSVYRASIPTDIDRFDLYVRSAGDAETETDRSAHLQHALGLVRGAPFGRDGLPWATAMITAAHQKVHNVAHDAAGLAIRLGLYKEADRAAEAGLRTDPVCSQCWDRQVEAANAAGDPDRARRLADARRDAVLV